VTFPPELPISARLIDLVNAIDQHQVVIVAGETGSGKTTQLPKMCLAMGRGDRGRIGCTQPRRIAATSRRGPGRRRARHRARATWSATRSGSRTP
jgi:ATP-dependent helicase HrpA